MENIKNIIKTFIYKNQVGLDVISMEHYCLDFKAELIFLGFTKTGKLKLGNTHACGPNKEDWKWKNIYGHIDVKSDKIEIRTSGSRYWKTINAEVA